MISLNKINRFPYDGNKLTYSYLSVPPQTNTAVVDVVVFSGVCNRERVVDVKRISSV